MTLNLKNYVASPDKQPYCSAHVPKASATTVADTPEGRRIAEVTKNQSKLAYTADYEKAKAQFTVVADTPELQAALRNTKNQSGVAYNQIRDRDAMGGGAQAMVSQQPQSVESVQPAAAAPAARAQQFAQSMRAQPAPAPAPVQQVEQPRQSYYEPAAPQQSYEPVAVAPAQPEPVQQAAASQEAAGERYRANYTYTPDADDELTFDVGDEIVNAKLVSEGWLLGTHGKTGKVGLFPEPYCTRV